MKHFIYETTNLIDGKKYRGKHSTNDINDEYLGSGIYLNRAIEKYGRENFKREILEFTDTAESALELEKEYVNDEWVSRKDTYNLKPGGSGGFGKGENHPWFGRSLTEEQCKSRSQNMLNYWSKPENMEHHIKRMTGKGNPMYNCGENHPLYGKHHSEETKKKIGDANRGKVWTEEERQRLSEAMIGRKYSEESKEKMSESRQEFWDNCSDEKRENIGKNISEGRKKKGSAKGMKNPKAARYIAISPEGQRYFVHGLRDHFIESFELHHGTIKGFIDRGIIPQPSNHHLSLKTEERLNCVSWQFIRVDKDYKIREEDIIWKENN